MRPDQNSSRCASSCDTRISVAPASRQHAPDLRHLRRDFLVRAVGLDEQDRRGVERIVGVHELLDRARRGLVHHLEARRNDAGADDRADRRAGLLDVVERRQRDLRQLRLRATA